MRKDDTNSSVYSCSQNFFDPKRNSEHFAIQVVNRGSFAVTIGRVGFYTRDGKDGIQIYKPALIEYSQWPCRLEPHEAITVVVPVNEILHSKRLAAVTKAFAKTQSGIIRKDKSKALKQLIQHAENANLRLEQQMKQDT